MIFDRKSDEFIFTLETNAVDSLTYSAKFFENRAVKSELKLAALLVFHAIELLFKARLAIFNPNLIFTNATKKTTIQFDAAKGQLIKRGIRFSKTENKNLDTLRDFRNNLEHHELKSNTSDVEACVRGALKFADAFSEHELSLSLRQHLGARKYNHIFREVYSKSETSSKRVIDQVLKRKLGRYQYWSCQNKNCDEGELVVPEQVKHNDRVQCSQCRRKFYISVCASCGEHAISAESFGEGPEPYQCGCKADEEASNFGSE